MPRTTPLEGDKARRALPRSVFTPSHDTPVEGASAIDSTRAGAYPFCSILCRVVGSGADDLAVDAMKLRVAAETRLGGGIVQPDAASAEHDEEALEQHAVSVLDE